MPLEKTGSSNAYNSPDAWNYFHINSVDKNDQGDYLISARHYSAIFKISGKTGKIIWQLGGSRGSDFAIPDNLHFAYQHDARFLHRSHDGEIEIISFFDNAAHSIPGRNISAFSRGRIVRLNHSTGTAEEIKTFPAPDDLSAHSQGNLQVLSNGNAFINWGQAGAVTEFDQNGTVLFHAYLDSQPYGKNVQSYRGFRYNWTGHASEDIAVVAVATAGSGDTVFVFVSWNGDTRTARWRLYSYERIGRDTQKTFLEEQERKSFETVFTLDITKGQRKTFEIFAEALDGDGHIIGTSRAVRSIDGVAGSTFDHTQWFQTQVEL